ncbi:MAG TPA: hypothetical protein VGQ33_01040, partial [Vicinamibacteria bacterium]|nr:hypothetical protein [Vicinamibacteria bacterium]
MRARTILAVLALSLLPAACRGRGGSAPVAPATATGAAVVSSGPAGHGAFPADVAAVDPKGRSLTLRHARAAASTSQERTIRVAGPATSTLASLQPGDRVVVACDTVDGEPSPGAGEDGALAACATVTSVTRVAS